MWGVEWREERGEREKWEERENGAGDITMMQRAWQTINSGPSVHSK